ncbi:S-formylglutathione hydrolase, partial [Haematococcus lacustris]
MDKLEPVSSWKQFGGWNRRYKVKSSSLGGTDTVFTVYTPPAAENGPVPVVYFLSGLTCTDDNFITKAGAQAAASRLGLALVAPDTSPRGLGVEGEAESWDFGVGAGFYLNATQP